MWALLISWVCVTLTRVCVLIALDHTLGDQRVTVDASHFFDALFSLRVAAHEGQVEACFMYAEVLRRRLGKSIHDVDRFYKMASVQQHCRSLLVLRQHNLAMVSNDVLRETAITQADRDAVEGYLRGEDEHPIQCAYQPPANAHQILAAIEKVRTRALALAASDPHRVSVDET